MRPFARNGAPSRRNADWAGRWDGAGGIGDWLPMGARKVMIASPAWFNPVMDATELEVTGRDKARIALAGGFMNHGEAVTRLRNARGRVTAIWFAGAKLLSEAALRREVIARYEK